MAKLKALTKDEKSTKLAELKAAMKLTKEPLTKVAAEHKAAVKAHKATTKALDALAKKLDKFSKAAETGAAKLQAKIDAINALPTIVEAKVKTTAVKKVADKAIRKAKATKAPAAKRTTSVSIKEAESALL